MRRTQRRFASASPRWTSVRQTQPGLATRDGDNDRPTSHDAGDDDRAGTDGPEPLEPVDEPETPPAANTARLDEVGRHRVASVSARSARASASSSPSTARPRTTISRELCETSCTGAEAQALESDGKAANRNAVIASVAGGAFVAAGVVFLVLSRRGAAASEPEVSLQLTRGGASAGYALRF